MFKPRMTKPEAGNPYYNTTGAGGYSKCIKGSPTDKGCNVLANCVGYASGRFNEVIGKPEMKYFNPGTNAEDFYDTAIAAGLEVGTKPQLGAIIVWAKGKTWTSADGAGHVAVVEEIKSDGSIITSESGYGCASPFWTSHRYKESGNWGQSAAYRFLGFIYQPEEPAPKYIKKGDKGASVELMQSRLAAKGYLRKNEVDGDFGTITLGAVCAFQLENGLDVDGICGPATQAILSK